MSSRYKISRAGTMPVERDRESHLRTPEMRDLRSIEARCEILATSIHASEISHLRSSMLQLTPEETHDYKSATGSRSSVTRNCAVVGTSKRSMK